MEEKIGIRYGGPAAHQVNEAWFRSVGVKKVYPFNFFTSRWMYRLHGLNQIIGFIHSLFIPRANIYLLTSPGSAIAAIMKKKMFGAKIISFNSDTFFTDLGKAKGLRKLYMNWIIKHLDGMISTSYLMKRLAEKYVAIPHEVVYPYCDVKKYVKVTSDYKSSNICTIGTGINTKGTDIMYKVFERFNKKFPKSKLYVCGHKDYIAHLKKPNNTVLTGVVDPAAYLAISGVYINTSRHESFGVNIVEAMCAGFAPLVTNKCGAAEIVEKVDKELVTSLDPKEIAQKAISLQKNVRKKIMLGKKARKMGIKFTKKRSVEEFKIAFRKIMKKIK